MIVTSFGAKGYAQYGERFIQTFLKYWPEDESLVIYYEEDPKIDHPRIECRDLFQVAGMAAFLDDVLESPPIFRGLRNDGLNYDYHFDAYKFSRKVYAITDAAKKYQGILTWIDADVYTHKPVPENYTHKLLDGHYLSHLYRDWSYTECGFMSFDTTHPQNEIFMAIYLNFYATGAFRYIGEWHDSYIFDVARTLSGVDSKDLAEGIRDNHPFVKSDLGQYMDHCKGNRKDKGFSPELFPEET